MSKQELEVKLALEDEAKLENIEEWAELHGAYQDSKGEWIV